MPEITVQGCLPTQNKLRIGGNVADSVEGGVLREVVQ